MEDDHVINAVDNCQVMSIHLPHEVNNKGVEISFSIQNDSNIKTADAYSKELDDVRMTSFSSFMVLQKLAFVGCFHVYPLQTS